MIVLRIDSIGGASGDMLLGMLIDLGVETAAIVSGLRGLGIAGLTIRSEQAVDRGLRGVRVHVEAPDAPHPHRGLADVERLIRAAGLAPATADGAIAIFRRLAEAEAAVHGTTVDAVHFHEVGALDALADIVGACLGLAALRVDRVDVGPLPVGRGTTRAAHGTLPLPVPAVAALLAGHAIVPTDEPSELVTPTGAAVLTAWHAGTSRGGRVIRNGYGLGRRTLAARANALRGMLIDTGEDGEDGEDGADGGGDVCAVLECAIDDMTGEMHGDVLDRLLAAGALDAYLAPIIMKKQRPGVGLTVLCRPEDRARMRDLIFRHTTTFGLRERLSDRTCLERRATRVTTPWGEVTVNTAFWNGAAVTVSPEYAACRRLADAAEIPLRRVMDAARAALNGAP